MGTTPASIGARCEYCTLAQVGQAATFHIDHIKPISAGGATEIETLALACVSCSLRKAARTEAEDPQTGSTAQVFHPRAQRWEAHFQWDGDHVIGTTSTGRATLAALAMNRPLMVAIRREEARLGRRAT